MHSYNETERLKAQRLGRPPSSAGAVQQASSWFDEVAAPRMQQMLIVQKEAVRGHDQALKQKVQDLTDVLLQASTAAYMAEACAYVKKRAGPKLCNAMCHDKLQA